MLLLILSCTAAPGGPGSSNADRASGAREPRAPAPGAPAPGAPTPRAAGDAVLGPGARPQTHREMVLDRDASRHPGDGGGSWRGVALPGPVEVGSPVQLVAEYVAGPVGIDEGGALTLIPSPFWGWSPPQGHTPDEPGFTVIEAPDGIVLQPRSGGGQLSVTVGGRALAPGEIVRFTYGSGDTARVDRFASRAAALWIGVDADGDGVRSVVPEPVSIEVVAGPAAQVVAILPSAAAPGEVVPLRLAVLDAVGNAFGRWPGTLTLQASSPRLSGPAQITLGPDDEGLATVQLVPEVPGVYTVTVAGVGPPVTTNPLVVRDGIEPILWGDLQIHSGLSDGTGDPAEVWRYAREVAALDVAAITDHDHWGMRFLDAHPRLWADLDRAVDEAYEPQRFVSIHGFEHTHWLYGHRHVLYFDGPGPLLSSLDPATDTPEELWAALQGRMALSVPHHPAGGPVPIDWRRGTHPVLEPVVEIASVHGQSEDPSLPGVIYDAVPGAFASEQLQQGRRLGLIGSTDGHDGHPGLSQLAGGHGGLAAILAPQRTRGAVYQALMARRVYATNGPRIVLRVSVRGAPPGSVLPAGPPAPIEARVVGTAPIERVELVGRGGVIGSQVGTGSLLFTTWELDAPAPGDLAYVRVVQVDGGLAWSSPVFFDPPEG
ncbi:MAG TPA: DUF3604 domain-containing protein [Deltaproteobacteria bacterium]|nr:DUF3604 domain-containing protein [Deltaproteobacteria bacterium]